MTPVKKTSHRALSTGGGKYARSGTVSNEVSAVLVGTVGKDIGRSRSLGRGVVHGGRYVDSLGLNHGGLGHGHSLGHLLRDSKGGLAASSGLALGGRVSSTEDEGTHAVGGKVSRFEREESGRLIIWIPKDVGRVLGAQYWIDG